MIPYRAKLNVYCCKWARRTLKDPFLHNVQRTLLSGVDQYAESHFGGFLTFNGLNSQQGYFERRPGGWIPNVIRGT